MTIATAAESSTLEGFDKVLNTKNCSWDECECRRVVHVQRPVGEWDLRVDLEGYFSECPRIM